jgi:hypothetical protein
MKTLSIALAIPAWIISLNMAHALDWTAEDEAQYIYHRQVLQELSQQYQQIQQDEVNLQIQRRQDAMEQQIRQNRDDMQRQIDINRLQDQIGQDYLESDQQARRDQFLLQERH